MNDRLAAEQLPAQPVGRGLALRLLVAGGLAAAALVGVYLMQAAEERGAERSSADVSGQARAVSEHEETTAARATEQEPERTPQFTAHAPQLPPALNAMPRATQSEVRAREPDTSAPGPSSVRADAKAAAADDPARIRTKGARGPHLQAGVFMQAANAEALKAQLEAQGLPVYIESRVQVGPFKDRRQAERVRAELKAKGVTTLLIAP